MLGLPVLALEWFGVRALRNTFCTACATVRELCAGFAGLAYSWCDALRRMLGYTATLGCLFGSRFLRLPMEYLHHQL